MQVWFRFIPVTQDAIDTAETQDMHQGVALLGDSTNYRSTRRIIFSRTLWPTISARSKGTDSFSEPDGRWSIR